MPFIKLDAQILTSTLWMDLEARSVFITALLMAEPLELTEPAPQLEVRSLTETGWQVPPGWYGFVPASGPGIVHRSIVSLDVGIPALERLAAPEPESRSQEHEGRRLVRVNHGYIVLNYFNFRDKDHTTKFRSKRYRDRLKLTPSRRDVTLSPRDTPVTSRRHKQMAEAEAKSDQIRREIPERSPEGSASPAATAAPQPKRKARRKLPDDFAPQAQHHSLATELGVSLADELPKFLDHHRAKGSLMLDWAAALRTWLRNARRWQPGPGNGPPKNERLQAQADRIKRLREKEAGHET